MLREMWSGIVLAEARRTVHPEGDHDVAPDSVDRWFRRSEAS